MTRVWYIHLLWSKVSTPHGFMTGFTQVMENRKFYHSLCVYSISQCWSRYLTDRGEDNKGGHRHDRHRATGTFFLGSQMNSVERPRPLAFVYPLHMFLQNMQRTSITAQTNENACENEPQSNIFSLRVKAGFLTKKSWATTCTLCMPQFHSHSKHLIRMQALTSLLKCN